MNTIQFSVIYPKVDRDFPDPSSPEQSFAHELPIDGIGMWKNNTAIRHGFCECIFVGMNMGSFQEFSWFLKERCRSMSVGDLINLDPNGLNEWWLCDSVGFVILTEEEKTSWLDYPRKFGCCSFEVNEWKKSLDLPV